MPEHDVDALIGDLEASYEWREDAPALVRDLLARLPQAPGGSPRCQRLTLLSLDELVRDHGTAGAARIVTQIRERAAAADDRGVQARAERALSSLFSKVGDGSAALEHAVAALALDDDTLLPALRCRVRLAMADALGACGSVEAARLRYRDALAHAKTLRSPWLCIAVLNNWAYTELVAQDLVAAAALAEQLQQVAQERGVVLNLVPAGTIAEILHGTGRSAEGAALLRRCLGDGSRRSVYDVAAAWVILGEMELATGDLAAAGTSLDVGDRLTTAHELHGLRVEVIGARAELLAARGDHAGAYATHVRFHAETLALRTAATESRAQTLHATLEADVARRESARYREMSYRDALTALLNRRHVDEDLDARLVGADDLAIALIDLDHFKRVNDTCSHDAGDAVLVRLAALLEAAVVAVPDAYAARLGGEEFLLVLPGAHLAAARDVAEGLRRRTAEHRWDDLAPGATVTVTVSIGLAAAASGIDQPRPDRARLLREADHHLYAAKTGGRDRVEPSIGPTAEPASRDHGS